MTNWDEVMGLSATGDSKLDACSAPAHPHQPEMGRRSFSIGREVWIGNASQALHPVAGQGLNLGLRDAFELATLLADSLLFGQR